MRWPWQKKPTPETLEQRRARLKDEVLVWRCKAEAWHSIYGNRNLLYTFQTEEYRKYLEALNIAEARLAEIDRQVVVAEAERIVAHQS